MFNTYGKRSKCREETVITRLLKAIVVSSFVAFLPALGNLDVLCSPPIVILWVFGIAASILQPDYNPFTIAAKQGDRGTGAQIIWSVYITQLAAVLECAYLRYPESVEWNGATIAAIVGMTLGLALRSWAVFTLGNLITMHIAVQENHTVIRRGPYRIVRHPSYLGAFVMYVSTTVLLHAWFSTVAAVVILPFAFVRRISYEENLLREQFGREYETYCSGVKRLFPGIW